MIKITLWIVALYLVSIPAVYSQVESLFQLVKAKTINKHLAEQFPVEKSFQGIQATFSDAKILIDALDQTIKLQMTASANNQTQQLVVSLIFTGDMQYYAFSESYIFDNPQLDSFKTVTDSFSDASDIVKAIKQSLINDFDQLVLFNLANLNSLNPKRPADEIEISQDQIRFVWH